MNPATESASRPSSQSVVIRPMRWWDIAPAQAIERACFPDDAWTESLFWSELAGSPETRYYVVAVAGVQPDAAVVGYAGLAVVDYVGDIQTIAVARAHQGLGLGARLLDELLAEARRRRARRVLLEVRSDNPSAIALYERRSFRRIDRRRAYYGTGIDALVMQLDVPRDDA
jgi:[ribosomal protein S18]-alanine N-acetyltransferase